MHACSRRIIHRMLLIGLFLLSGVPTQARDLTFAWFSELAPEHSFWQQNFAFAKAAADDLGVTLIAHYVRSDQLLYRRLLAEAATGPSGSRADGIVFLNMKRQGTALLEIVEAGDIPAVSNVLAMEYDRTGLPRERYRSWIAEIVDDEENNGYELAVRLLDEARRLNLRAPDGHIHFVAIHGKASDSAAIRRKAGLELALAERDDVRLQQSFQARNWSRAEGARFTSVALRRYPDTTVVWSANDDVLLGVLDASKTMGRSPGRDILTGAIDGTIQVIEKVAAGEVVCTISGLAMHSGWAVVLLHDYLNGVDFEDDAGVIVRNRNTVVDRSNARRYLERFGDGDWSRVDFTRFSKVTNPDLQRYDFSIQTLLDRD